MNIRISLLSDEIREDNAAKKLRMRHKRATTFRRFTGEPASHMTGIGKKAIRTRIMWYENQRIWHERKPRALCAWHESNANLAQKEFISKHQNGAGRSAAAAASTVPGGYHNSYKWFCCTCILFIRVHSYSISARTNSIRAHTNSIRVRTYSIRARINSISSGSNCITVSTNTIFYIILELIQWNPTQIE